MKTNSYLEFSAKVIKKICACHIFLVLGVAYPVAQASYAQDLDKPPKHVGDVQALSLKDAVFLALRHNPDIKNAEINRVIQKYALRVAQNEFELKYKLSGDLSFTRTVNAGSGGAAGGTGNNTNTGGTRNNTYKWGVSPGVSYKTPWGTSLSLNTNIDYTKNDIQTSRTLNESFAPGLGVSLSQPLLKGAGRNIVTAGLKSAYDSEESNKLNLKQKIGTHISAIVKAYRGLILDNNNLKTTEQSLKDAKLDIKRTRARIDAGQLAPSSIIEKEAQLEKLKLAFASALNDSDQKRQSLLESIGLDPNRRIKVPNDVKVDKMVVPDLQETIDKALVNNVAYQDSIIGMRGTKRNLAAAKNNMLPTLDLSAGASLGTDSNRRFDSAYKGLFSGKNHSERVGLKWEIPINQLSQKQSLANAKIKLQQAETALEASKRKLITDIKNRVTNIKSQVNQIKISKRNVGKAKKAYDITRKKQQLGRASSLDVSNAQDSYINSKKSMIEAKIKYLNAMTELSNELGTTLDDWDIQLHY